MGLEIMGKLNEKELRNLGITLALGNLTGDISKISMNGVTNYVIDTFCGKLVIDPENNYNGVDSYKVIGDVIADYNYKFGVGQDEAKVGSDSELYLSLANTFNAMKSSTLDDLRKLDSYKNYRERTFSPEADRILELDNKINDFFNTFYMDVEPNKSNEYKILENAMHTYYLVFGKGGISKKTLLSEVNYRDIEPYYCEVAEFCDAKSELYGQVADMFELMELDNPEAMLEEFFNNELGNDEEYDDYNKNEDDEEDELSQADKERLEADINAMQEEMQASPVNEKFMNYLNEKMKKLFGTEEEHNLSDILNNPDPKEKNMYPYNENPNAENDEDLSK